MIQFNHFGEEVLEVRRGREMADWGELGRASGTLDGVELLSWGIGAPRYRWEE